MTTQSVYFEKDCGCNPPSGSPVAISGESFMDARPGEPGRGVVRFSVVYEPRPRCTVCGKQWRMTDPPVRASLSGMPESAS